MESRKEFPLLNRHAHRTQFYRAAVPELENYCLRDRRNKRRIIGPGSCERQRLYRPKSKLNHRLLFVKSVLPILQISAALRLTFRKVISVLGDGLRMTLKLSTKARMPVKRVAREIWDEKQAGKTLLYQVVFNCEQCCYRNII